MGRRMGALILLAGLPTTVAQAQTTMIAGTSLTSGYLWRGITLTNRPVIQPGLELRRTSGRLTLSVAGWANVDAGRYDDARALSQSGGGSPLDLSEFDGTVTLSLSTAAAVLSAGTIWYAFPNPAALTGFNPAANTVEVFGKVALTGPLSPALGIWYDAGKIDGGYLEASLGHRLDRALGGRPLQLGLLAGWSAGQDAALDGAGVPTAPFYSFETNGLTHLDASVGTDFAVLGLTVAPAVHLVYGRDPATRHISPSRSRDLKISVGASISRETLIGKQR